LINIKSHPSREAKEIKKEATSSRREPIVKRVVERLKQKMGSDSVRSNPKNL
jgi:hypothetical protein